MSDVTDDDLQKLQHEIELGAQLTFSGYMLDETQWECIRDTTQALIAAYREAMAELSALTDQSQKESQRSQETITRLQAENDRIRESESRRAVERHRSGTGT